jgi:hypothetical protein
VSDNDEKTRVTQVVQAPPPDQPAGNDCVVVIYAAEAGLLGKRFVLERSPTRVGRGGDNAIVLEGDSVSRRHAHLVSDRRRVHSRWRVRGRSNDVPHDTRSAIRVGTGHDPVSGARGRGRHHTHDR